MYMYIHIPVHLSHACRVTVQLEYTATCVYMSTEVVTFLCDCVSLSPAADLLVQYPDCLLCIIPVLQLSDRLWSGVCHLLPCMFGGC